MRERLAQLEVEAQQHAAARTTASREASELRRAHEGEVTGLKQARDAEASDARKAHEAEISHLRHSAQHEVGRPTSTRLALRLDPSTCRDGQQLGC